VFCSFTLKPSRLVDLGSSCCFTSYRSLVATPYFLHILVANSAKAKDFDPSNFLLLRSRAIAFSSGCRETQNSFNSCGTLLPLKNPKLLLASGVDFLVGRLGFEPRQSAPKALDLPLVDRPVIRRSHSKYLSSSLVTSEVTLRTFSPSTRPEARSPL
jgi:hypothetical protein